MKKIIKLCAYALALVMLAAAAIVPAYAASMGDVDGDGEVTSQDARLALRYAIGLEGLTSSQKALADMDKDGDITAADARSVLRKAIGLEDGQSSGGYLTAASSDFVLFENTVSKFKSLPDRYNSASTNGSEVTGMLFDLANEITELYDGPIAQYWCDDRLDPLKKFDEYEPYGLGRKYPGYYVYSADRLEKLAADTLDYRGTVAGYRPVDYKYDGNYYFAMPGMLGGLLPYPDKVSVKSYQKNLDGTYTLTCLIDIIDDYSEPEFQRSTYEFVAGLRNIDGRRTWTIYSIEYKY